MQISSLVAECDSDPNSVRAAFLQVFKEFTEANPQAVVQSITHAISHKSAKRVLISALVTFEIAQ